MSKLTCKKLPDFREMFDVYYKPYFKSYGISRTFKIQQNQTTKMFEVRIDVKVMGEYQTIDAAVEFANKLNKDDYLELIEKINKWSENE